MTREQVFSLISAEREYQNAKWGSEFDDKNTRNDWVAYISQYLGKAVTFGPDTAQFRNALTKVAALAVAALERENYAPRHYDEVEPSTPVSA